MKEQEIEGLLAIASDEGRPLPDRRASMERLESFHELDPSTEHRIEKASRGVRRGLALALENASR